MKPTLTILALVLTYPAIAQPTSPLGGLPGSPFRMGFGAQGIGYGNACVSARTETIAGYYNPALLPFQPKQSVFASVSFLTLDRILNFIHYSQHLEPRAGISFGLINSGVTNVEGRDRDGNQTETSSTSENAFLLSFGLQLDPTISIGISTKILYYKLYSDLHSTTVGLDIGVAYLLSDEWTIGACIQDIGSKYKWDTSRLYALEGNSTIDYFPVRRKIGVTFSPQGLALRGSLEVEHINKILLLRGGVEFFLHEQFSLRGGLDQLSFSDGFLPRPSVGFSARAQIGSRPTILNYAYVIEPYAPAGFHVISIGLEFQ